MASFPQAFHEAITVGGRRAIVYPDRSGYIFDTSGQSGQEFARRMHTSWCHDGFNHLGLDDCLDYHGRYSRLTDAQKVDVNSEVILYVQWELIAEYHAQNQFRRAIHYGVSISIILWSIFYYMWIIA